METRKSLLLQAKSGPDSDAWFELLTIYQPLISGWVSRAGIATSEVGDISQEVLQTVAKELPDFDHNGRQGAFRNWLKAIAINRCKRYWDWKKKQVPLSSTNEIQLLSELSDPTSTMSETWDREHDHYVLQKIVAMVENQFSSRTSEIFSRYAIEGEDAQRVAESLNVSVGIVYKTKFKVIRWIREVASGLIDVDATLANNLNDSSFGS